MGKMILCKAELMMELKKQNPDVSLSWDRPGFYTTIVSTVSGKDLKLPEGFYYRDGIISNKENSRIVVEANVITAQQ